MQNDTAEGRPHESDHRPSRWAAVLTSLRRKGLQAEVWVGEEVPVVEHGGARPHPKR